jgi:molecular chaperone DnaK
VLFWLAPDAFAWTGLLDNKMTRAIGIDLGTTYTVVAVIENGQPKIIPNAEGQPLTPSVVSFVNDGWPLVGQMAIRQASANNERTVFSIKRRMGSNYKVSIDEREYTPQELSSLILRKVKTDAEHYLGERIEKAAITVPAYFNDRQRQATKEAGIIAGLDVIRIISEPTAAALAYGFNREDIRTVLVWDLGGGTFDVSVLELDEGIFEVRAVSGNTWLGGDDYDKRLMEYLAEQYKETYGTDFPRDGADRQRLREAAERAKIDLSERSSTSIYLPFIGGNSVAFSHLETTLTRDKFQELTRDLLQKLVGPTQQALTDAELKPQDIDRVVLVGGATRMPAVQEIARQLLGKDPYQSINPDEVVALGAAIQAGMLLGVIDQAVLLDVLPLSLGIETQRGLFARIIRRNTPLPASESRIFTTADDNQTSMDIHVLQGERELANDNLSLGQFQLDDIPPLPRGTPKIEVSFDVDLDGIVQVSAIDLLTENTQSVRVVSSKGLSPLEIHRMIEEAETSAQEDREKRALIEAGIEADSAISAAEMAIGELHEYHAEALAEEVWRAILDVKEALASGQSDKIRCQSAELRELLGSTYRQVRSGARQRV